MRCEDIKVTFTIPMPIDKPDKNGVIYTENAIKQSIDNYKNKLAITDENKNCIGFTTDAEYYDGCMCVDGIIKYGGTCEKVELDGDSKVIHMEIESFGLSL